MKLEKRSQHLFHKQFLIILKKYVHYLRHRFINLKIKCEHGGPYFYKNQKYKLLKIEKKKFFSVNSFQKFLIFPLWAFSENAQYFVGAFLSNTLLSMLFNLLLANITILLCFFFLFRIVFNNFFTIPVEMENASLKLALVIPNAIEILPVVTDKTINDLSK